MKSRNHFRWIAWLLCIHLSLIGWQAEAQNNRMQTMVGGPYNASVNAYAGNLYVERQDMYIPSEIAPWDITFSYNSLNRNRNTGYGWGWSSTFNLNYQPNGLSMVLERADGHLDYFTPNGSGGYTSPPGVFDTFSQYNPGKYSLTSKDGTVYYFDNPGHQKLTKIQYANGNFTQFNYTGNQLTSTTDNLGRTLNFVWSGGNLSQVINNMVSPARTFTYYYDAQGNPITVTDAMGGQVSYTYAPNNLLTAITNQNGNTLNITYNMYAAVSQLQSPLNQYNFAYDPVNLNTTISMPVSGATQSTIYTFDNIGRLISRAGSCCGFNTLYQYDSQNNLTQLTDALGGIYTYTYDVKGNVLAETDPLGNAVTNTYDPITGKQLSVTDKNGNTTSFTYDMAGNLVSILYALGIQEQFTYNSLGLKTSHTDGDGNITNYAYDPNGYMVAETDAMGGTQTFNYNIIGELQSRTDFNGNTWSYAYTSLGQQAMETDPLGNITSHSYDGVGNHTSITDGMGNVTVYNYDALNRQIEEIDPMSAIVQSSYDEAGNVTSIIDALGNTTSYTYSLRNQKLSVTDPIGNSKTFSYDALGNLASVTDFNGNTMGYTVDGLGRVLSKTDALGNSTTYSYDAGGNVLSITNPLGNAKSWTYDALNRKVTVSNPTGLIKSFTWDGTNQLLTETDGNGSTTTHVYNARNQLVQSTDPMGGVSQYILDANGNWLTLTNAIGVSETWTYDALGQELSYTNGLGQTDQYTYNIDGTMATKTLAAGTVLTLTYDNAGRMLTSSDNLGAVFTYTYDLNGNVLTRTDGTGTTTSMSYDANDRLVSSTDGVGANYTFAYDGNGNLTSRTDRNGNVNTFSYDVRNRPIAEQDALGNSTTVAIDAGGNVTSITDANGNTTTYTWDASRRLTQQTFPDGSQMSFGYDVVGNAISKTDQNGNTTTYQYNANDLLTKRDYPGANDDVFVYDAIGRITSANNANATLSYTFDNANRMLSEVLNGNTTSYAFSLSGGTRTITYPSGKVVVETYDVRDNLTNISYNGSAVSTLTYNGANRMTQRKSHVSGSSTDLITDFTRNGNGKITQLDHKFGTSLFAGYKYGYDAEDNPLYQEDQVSSSLSQQFQYDVADRLIDFKVGVIAGGVISTPTTHIQYTMDGLANRGVRTLNGTTTTYTSDNRNRYTATTGAGATNFTYDANGNMTGDGTFVYAYDYNNHVVSVDNGSTAIYEYGPLGRRISKVVGSNTTNFFYDRDRCIEEQDQSGTTTANHVFGIWVDDIVLTENSGSTFFYHKTANGSVAAATSASTGAVLETYEYDDYGNVTMRDGVGTVINSTGIQNSFLFASRRLDAETGLYFSRARHYSPALGRFLQTDPLGFIDSYNVYEYVKSGPAKFIDPFGTDTYSVTGTVQDDDVAFDDDIGQVTITLEIKVKNCELEITKSETMSLPKGVKGKVTLKIQDKKKVNCCCDGTWIKRPKKRVQLTVILYETDSKKKTSRSTGSAGSVKAGSKVGGKVSGPVKVGKAEVSAESSREGSASGETTSATDEDYESSGGSYKKDLIYIVKPTCSGFTIKPKKSPDPPPVEMREGHTNGSNDVDGSGADVKLGPVTRTP